MTTTGGGHPRPSDGIYREEPRSGPEREQAVEDLEGLRQQIAQLRAFEQEYHQRMKTFLITTLETLTNSHVELVPMTHRHLTEKLMKGGGTDQPLAQ